jgi:hypothetical protein
MTTATSARVAGEDFKLDAQSVERAVAEIDPEPIREHYVLIGLRRYPPKQVLAAVTGLDRGDFTTHQARSILRRLGFGVYRKGYAPPPQHDDKARWPQQGREAAALAPYKGRYVAQDGLEVLYESDSPYDVVRWLRKNGLRARVWRVPATAEDVGSMITEG